MGSYANQIKRVTGEWENMKADVGAPIAGGLAIAMQQTREKGIGSYVKDALRGNEIEAAGRQMGQGNVSGGMSTLWGALKSAVTFGPTASMQEAADKNAGVQKGFGKAAPRANPELDMVNRMFAARDRMFAARDRMEADQFEAKKFSGGGFGAMGALGGFGAMMNQQAMRAGLNKEIKEQKGRMNAWGGGHVMDSESFMRQAQERLLTKDDDTAKKQLAELIKAREALDKIAGRQEGKQAVKGVVLKGRES